MAVQVGIPRAAHSVGKGGPDQSRDRKSGTSFLGRATDDPRRSRLEVAQGPIDRLLVGDDCGTSDYRVTTCEHEA